MERIQIKRGYYLDRKEIECPLDHKLNCFECPFPRCIANLGLQVYNSWVRRKRTEQLLNNGYNVKQIAKELGVTVHTINHYRRGLALNRLDETTTTID